MPPYKGWKSKQQYVMDIFWKWNSGRNYYLQKKRAKEAREKKKNRSFMDKYKEMMKLKDAYTPARKPVNKGPAKKKPGMGKPITFGKRRR